MNYGKISFCQFNYYLTFRIKSESTKDARTCSVQKCFKGEEKRKIEDLGEKGILM